MLESNAVGRFRNPFGWPTHTQMERDGETGRESDRLIYTESHLAGTPAEGKGERQPRTESHKQTHVQTERERQTHA